MGRISEKTIRLVEERATITDAVERLGGLQLTRKGVRAVCRCPFHNEKTASFHVSESRNTAHCFGGCGKTWEPISFVMEHENLSYPEAIRRLAAYYHIDVEEERPPQTDEERKRRAEEEAMEKRKESAVIMTEEAARFYAGLLDADTPAAKAAKSYAERRWGGNEGIDGKNFLAVAGIGYGGSGRELVAHLKQKGYSLELAAEIGLVAWSDRDHDYYDPFAHRVTIPIRDPRRRVIGFTARDIEGKSAAKYVNSKDSFLFHKGHVLFGFDQAKFAGRRQKKYYMVEGGPDVLRLQKLGVCNAVAPLGTALTDEQLALLDKANKICFIPDSDEIKPGEQWGTGIKKVMENGRKAVAAGFKVTVKEIPSNGGKEDCDSYVKTVADLKELKENDFAVWYASKLFNPNDSDTEQAQKIRKICEMLPPVEGLDLDTQLDTLGQMTEGRTRSYWKKAYVSVMEERNRDKAEKASKEDKEGKDLLRKYGFYEVDGCYFSTSGAQVRQWSNFTMRPLMHIEENGDAIRLFEIRNKRGRRRTIELQQADLVSLARFQQQVEARGNYLWMGTMQDLFRLKEYLYEETKTAIVIRQLGWQRRYGFWAWGNGIYADGTFYPVEDMGVVTIKRDDKEERYYLPGASSIHAGETERFQFERKFKMESGAKGTSLPDFCMKMEKTFGANTKIGIAYLLASMFYDIIVAKTVNFPLLNLFGPKGSGKSEFGTTLMSLFIRDNRPQNVQNGTIPGMAQTIAQSANAICHIDEYKNNIGPEKNEMLKGIYDRVGRTRMKMGSFGEKESTKVDQGVILSGQEMPTADIALFSRTIFLSFESSVHTAEQKRNFNELAALRTLGVMHLCHDILDQRRQMEDRFDQEYERTLGDLSKYNTPGTEDRIYRDWAMLLAVYRTLREPLALPWGDDEMERDIAAGIARQNEACTTGNEMGVFWRAFAVMIARGSIYADCDYKLKTETELKTKLMPRGYRWDGRPRLVLMLTKIDHIVAEYQQQCKSDGNKAMDRQTIDFYMQHSPGYLGRKITHERCKLIIKGEIQMEEKTTPLGATELRQKIDFLRPECFDYAVLQQTFGLDLGTNPNPEEEEEDIVVF